MRVLITGGAGFLGLRTNLDGTRAVLDWARAHPGPQSWSSPVRSRSSAILPRPRSSYGFQKFIGEQLAADYTRREYLRGRSVRADDRRRPAGVAQRGGVRLPVRPGP